MRCRGLVLFLGVIALALSGCEETTDPGEAVTAGSDGGACYGNGTCDAGLECVEDLCVSSAGGVGAPSVTITSPADASVVQLGDPVSLEAVINDDVDSPETLTAQWSSDLDGPLGNVTPSTDGQCTFLATTLTAGIHTLTLKATDSGGRVGSASVAVNVNAPPTAPTVILEPEAPTTSDDLTATFTKAAEDPNRALEDLTLSYRWFQDDVEQPAFTGPYVPSLATAKGEAWRVQARAFDGYLYGEEAVAEVVIANSLAACDTVVVLPSAGDTTTPFDCQCNGRSDADPGDTPVDTCTFLNGEAELTTVDAVDGLCTLDPGLTARGMTLTCRYLPGDQDGPGAATTSGEVIVQNAPPTAPVTSLSPAAGGVETLFTCQATELATDLDGDSLSTLITWTVGGYANPGSTTFSVVAGQLSKDDDGTPATKGDVLQCGLVADDGLAQSEIAWSQELTLGNTAPTGGSVLLGPMGATEASTLTCSASGAEDVDPDDEISWIYAWYVDGELVEGATESTLTGDHFDKGQSVTCIASPTDGESEGEPVTSKVSITIGNTLPTIGEVSLIDAESLEPETNRLGTLECAVGTWQDPDPADASPSLGWAWYLVADDGTWTVLPEALGPSLDALDVPLAAGDQVACEATPFNGAEAGVPVASNLATVINNPPLAPTLTLVPEGGAVETLFTCALAEALTDPDEDPLTVSYSWVVNGHVDPDAAGASVTPTALVSDDAGSPATGGDSLRCRAIADDGLALSVEGESPPLVLTNTPPSGGVVTLQPTEAYETTSMICEGSNATDPDAQGLNWVYKWAVDGVEIEGYGGNTLTGVYFDKGQVVSCAGTPSDGIASGDPVAAEASVTIANSLPSLVQALVTPTQANKTSIFTCSFGGWGDPDPTDAEATVNVQWYLKEDTDDLPILGASALTFSPGDLNPGDQVFCRATPVNGDEAGAPVDSNVATVVNTAPSIESVKLSPGDAFADTLLSCAPEGFYDADGDPPAYAYGWQIGGAFLPGATQATLAGAFSKGDSVRCVVTPSDGLDEGPAVISNALIIGNKLPLIGQVKLSPSFGASCDTYTCEATDIVDPDIDDILLTSYRWEVEGLPLEGAQGETLTLPDLIPGDMIQCFVSASDGTVGPPPEFLPVTGPEVASNLADIVNNPPALASVKLAPWEGTVVAVPGTIIACTPEGFSDPECEPTPQYVYKWYKGAELIADASEKSLDTSGYGVGTVFACQAIPFDGWDYGTPKTSNTVTLTNNPPSPPVVAIEASADGAAPVTCVVVQAASDDEPLTTTWLWSVNGGPEAPGPQTLSAAEASACDLLTCRAMVDDGLDAASSNTAALQLANGAGCDDGEVCTDHACDPAGGCAQQANSAPCTDGDPCTLGDGCADMTCQAGTLKDCSGNTDPCLASTCNPASGACDMPTPDGVLCPDGDVCNGEETCLSGSCQPGEPLGLSDGVGCTVDSCDPITGVAHTPDHAACDTGQLCVTDLCDLALDCTSTVTPGCCGNSILETGEACDDGNAETEVCPYGEAACSVCTADCQWTTGVLTGYCGDGATDDVHGEGCDDGNALTEVCPYGQSACTICDASCQPMPGALTGICGDGAVQNPYETCDDGGSQTEACVYGETACTVCDASCQAVDGAVIGYCGDGSLQGAQEVCDDGAANTTDCAYGEPACTVCTPGCEFDAGAYVGACGDGSVQTDYETCDDGNEATEACPYGEPDCTVCTAPCQLGPGVSTGACGDGVLDPTQGEACEEGNTAAGDGCDDGCQLISQGMDCAGLHMDHPDWPSGIYVLDHDGDGPAPPFEAYCDMLYDGGGWTLAVVSSDDGQHTWTWNNRRYWDTDETTFGSAVERHRDYKSPAHHGVAMNDLLFIHAPSGVWAAYHDVFDGLGSFADFIGSYEDSTCWPTADQGFPMSAGTLSAADNLCSTQLFINPQDHDGWNGGCDLCGLACGDTHGPAWSAAFNDWCPLDDPAGSGSMGPNSYISQEDVEGGSSWFAELGDDVYIHPVGYGWALGLNSGAAGTGQNHLKAFVRRAICGNGHLEGGETCDDGNAFTEACAYGETACTVCDATCQSVPGATGYCGDGTLQGTEGEGCDDGNTVTDACTYGASECVVCDATCQPVPGAPIGVCGDGVTQGDYESCDDGNAETEVCDYGLTACTVCDATCQSAPGDTSYCGDGVADSEVVCETAPPSCGEGGLYAAFEPTGGCPVAYWDMETLNESTGHVRDLVGTNDLEIFGDPVPASVGISGTTYEIQNTDSYFISIEPFPSQLQGSGAKSIAAWVNIGVAETMPIAGFGGQLDPTWSACNLQAFGLVHSTSYGGAGFSACPTLFHSVVACCGGWLHNWRHLVATYDGEEVRLYVDGEPAGSQEMELDTNNAFDRFTVGADHAYGTQGGSMPDGRVDEVKVYDYALTDAQALALYNLGLEGPVEITTCTTLGELCDDGDTETAACAYGEAQCTVCGADCQWADGEVSLCGDGVLQDAHEGCDDGDTETEVCGYGDAGCTVCDANCQWTDGAYTGACGDGILDPSNGESCDDGNLMTETCDYGVTACSVCGPSCLFIGGLNPSYCGDGVVESDYEACDDGNTETEACAYGETECTVCDGDCFSVTGAYTGSCGDGVLQEDHEACDDGNVQVEDCAYGETSCTVCDDVCQWAGGQITGYCGDGVLQADAEDCDDGGNVEGDGCPGDCTLGVQGLDCSEIHFLHPDWPDGSYLIDPAGDSDTGSIEVYCDMTTDGGGWTLTAALANRRARVPAPAPFFTANVVQGLDAWSTGSASPLPSIDARGVLKVDDWPIPDSIRYRLIDLSDGATVNQMVFNDADSITHLQQHNTPRDERFGAGLANAAYPIEEVRAVYDANDHEAIWGYDATFGRMRDTTDFGAGWQFGVSVNLPDDVAGYDGLHDDKGRTEYNLGVAGYQGASSDISSYWPSQCESACTNEDWATGTGFSGRAVLQVWYRRAMCGDGVMEGAEACDDGATVSGDGCSETCAVEVADLVCAEGDLVDGCWVQLDLSGPVPEARTYHVMAYDTHRQRTVMTSGTLGGIPYPDDVWELDLSGWTKISDTGGFSGRVWASMTFDNARGEALLYGGKGTSNAYGDLWRYEAPLWSSAALLMTPGPKHAAAMVYDSGREVTVLFGGYQSGDTGDTWEWDGVNWTLRFPETNPPARRAHAMAYDPDRQRVVLFGGAAGLTALSDTWEWDGDDWQEVTTAGSPTARLDASMSYHTPSQHMVLFGGTDYSSVLDDTWVYDGDDWTQLNPAVHPSSRSASTLVDSTSHGGALLFGGGLDSGLTNESWVFLYAPPVCGDGVIEGTETCDGDCQVEPVYTWQTSEGTVTAARGVCTMTDSIHYFGANYGSCDGATVGRQVGIPTVWPGPGYLWEVKPYDSLQDGVPVDAAGSDAVLSPDGSYLEWFGGRDCGADVIETVPATLYTCTVAAGCDDGNICTADVVTGSAETCDVVCTHTDIAACADDDGCCAPGCSSTDDNDCVDGRHCNDIHLLHPDWPDGVYIIEPFEDGAHAPFAAYCDMTTDGGGWTLVVRGARTSECRDTMLLGQSTIDAPLDPLAELEGVQMFSEEIVHAIKPPGGTEIGIRLSADGMIPKYIPASCDMKFTPSANFNTECLSYTTEYSDMPAYEVGANNELVLLTTCANPLGTQGGANPPLSVGLYDCNVCFDAWGNAPKPDAASVWIR